MKSPSPLMPVLSHGQFRIGSRTRRSLLAGPEVELSSEHDYGWRSRALEQREPSPVLRASWRGVFPAIMAAVLDFSGRQSATLEMRMDSDVAHLEYGDASALIPVGRA